MTHEVAQDKQYPTDWRYEGIDTKTGDCYVVIFSGPNAEKRARGYCDWVQSVEDIKFEER